MQPCGAGTKRFEYEHDVEDERDRCTDLTRAAQNALDLIALAIDEHDPAPPVLWVATRRFGERVAGVFIQQGNPTRRVWSNSATIDP